MNFSIIEITWSEKTFIDLSKTDKIPAYKNCLYQAYGDSPIYGRDSLLYIGQTKDSLSRTIDHLKTDFARINNFSLIIGTIDHSQQKSLSIQDKLNLAESLLITMVKPSYNSQNIRDTKEILKENQKYLLLNLKNRGSLPLEISNVWWG